MRFIYFSPIMWDDLKQRPQHIAEELSKNNEVIFVEPSVSFIKGLKGKKYKKRYLKINENLEIVRFSGFLKLPKSLNFLDFCGIAKYFERKQLKKFSHKKCIIWFGSPIFYSYLSCKNKEFVVYDKMDDYVALTSNKFLKKIILTYEENLLKRANLIFTSSNLMFEKLNSKYSNVKLIKNGISEDFLNPDLIVHDFYKQIIKDIKKENKKIFGYIGAIDYWFDFKIIDIILKDPLNVVILVGRFNIKPIKHKNLYCFEKVEKKMVPGIISSFDYCLYPFDCDFIDTIDPVKMYEYIAMNKVVLAKMSLETSRFTEGVYLYNDKQDFDRILKVSDSLKKPFNSKEYNLKFINKNSWVNRSILLNEILKDIIKFEEQK